MCTAAEVGPRPEKKSKETTSLGMSSLPTLDGSNYPTHPSGQNPEIGNPESSDHSVTVSVCPTKPSDLDSIKLETLKASAELQMTSEKKEHLPRQDFSDCASSVASAPEDDSRALPLQDSSEEAIVADNPEMSPAERSTQDLKSYLHTTQESGLLVTTTRMQETWKFSGENFCYPEHQSLSKVNNSLPHKIPVSEQHEIVPHNQEHLCSRGDLELAEGMQQNIQKSVDLEATMQGDGLYHSVDLHSIHENALCSGCFGCSNSETLMEVDTVEQPLVTVPSSAGSQNANVKSAGASDLILYNPSMEVETLKCNTSSKNLSSAISAQALQLSEGNVEMSGTNTECGDCPHSLSLCGSCQPSVDTEESCSSITAALKELHGLLVISKTASGKTSEEITCQSETVVEDQTVIKDLSKRWTHSEHFVATPSEQPSQVSFHQTISVSVKTEKPTDASTGAGLEDIPNSSFGGSGDSLLIDKEVSESRESINESNSVTSTSAKIPNQLQCTFGVEISPTLLADKDDALSQTSKQTKSLSSSFIMLKDLGQGTQSSMTDGSETREDICSEAAEPLLEFEPPPGQPTILPPLIFPAADIDRILQAGFTLQEALGALHRVGGNADLALLVLLAKNIVVPT